MLLCRSARLFGTSLVGHAWQPGELHSCGSRLCSFLLDCRACPAAPVCSERASVLRSSKRRNGLRAGRSMRAARHAVLVKNKKAPRAADTRTQRFLLLALSCTMCRPYQDRVASLPQAMPNLIRAACSARTLRWPADIFGAFLLEATQLEDSGNGCRARRERD